MTIYGKYCTSSPWCEPDQVCRCEQWEEYEAEEKRKEREGITAPVEQTPKMV